MINEFDKIQELLYDYDEMSGGYFLAHCVFHDDAKKSLLIYPDGYNCRSGECRAKGPLNKLIAVLEDPGNLPRIQVAEYERPPYIPSDIEQLKKFVERSHLAIAQGPERTFYLRQRGVTKMVRRAKLGWYEGWITVPIFNSIGNLAGLYARATPAEQEATGQRFHQPHGSRPQLYTPGRELLNSSPTVAVVFGMMDALVLASLNIPVVTTTGGSGDFDAGWLDEYRKNFTIFPDASGDTEPAYELAAQLGWRGRVRWLPYDEEVEDPADFAKEDVDRKDELHTLVWEMMHD